MSSPAMNEFKDQLDAAEKEKVTTSQARHPRIARQRSVRTTLV